MTAVSFLLCPNGTFYSLVYICQCRRYTDEHLDSSQAARHRYLCLGNGITPVLAASLPEEPSIDAQANSKTNKQIARLL